MTHGTFKTPQPVNEPVQEPEQQSVSVAERVSISLAFVFAELVAVFGAEFKSDRVSFGVAQRVAICKPER